MLSFAQDSHSHNQTMAEIFSSVIVLCRGAREDGEAFWAYLCIKPSYAKAFRDARTRGVLSLEDYGTVLEWAVGEDPPAEIIQKMEQQFGVTHNCEAKLLDAIESFC